ncbi:MAG: SusD/RagB family nutrient-binding outer membrane lipoprotein [Tannerellaceae bacterium]|jgi:hypothetical protein|nr:SusD/RagB family nutrient-binding outer membrane lipoprotein [Tannerellaceae bacterium]
MKRINCTAIVILALATLFSCTGGFEEMNTNPYGVTDLELTQDNNLIGMHFPTIQQSIYYNRGGGGYTYQVFQNLNADIWSGYMATPSNFKGGINNQTYFLNNDWNDNCWSYTYNNVMANQLRVKEKCAEQGDLYAHYAAINSILRVLAMSRICDQYGPIIYSQYGQSLLGGEYDSAEDTYRLFFAELEEAVNTLNVSADKPLPSFASFDMAYKGDLKKWTKLGNTIRLRLAMRIVKYDPAWAKTEAEKAIAAPQGLLGRGESFIISGFGWKHPLYTCSIEYQDIFISANIQSIMGGYNDPRLEKFGIAKNGKVTGVRTGIPDLADLADPYKALISTINVTAEQEAVIVSAAEAYFLLAEAALRGWNTNGGSDKAFYEEGISVSFAQWGVSAGDYASRSAKPADWTDPIRDDFNSEALSKISPNYDEAADKEERLEKIITQKWISGFPEGMNAWAEWRRTGYPKLFPILKNDSQGAIPTSLGVRRLTYTLAEQRNNPAGYAKAVQLLGGPDTGATRLFWDNDKPNL